MGLHIEWPDFPQRRDTYVHIDDDYDVPGAVDGVVITETDETTGAIVLRVTMDLRFDVDGPRASRMMFEEGTQRLTKTFFSSFDPDGWAQRLLAFYGFKTWGTGRSVFTPDPAAAWGALDAMPRRRSVTQRRLEEVAAAFERDGARAVQRDCHVSKSQAYRLVDQAREAGLLPAKESRS